MVAIIAARIEGDKVLRGVRCSAFSQRPAATSRQPADLRRAAVPPMAAANASPRAQRSAILASPLHGLTGFCLKVDCVADGCRRDRMFAVSELASFYGRDRMVGEVLRRMRCSGGCGGRVVAAWLVTGPVMNMRVRPRRMALLGPEARG
jgi:hypothetical protein